MDNGSITVEGLVMGVRSLGEDKIELSAENIMVGLQLF
jgi:hypothetical protein